jgi:hypothetical protein
MPTLLAPAIVPATLPRPGKISVNVRAEASPVQNEKTNVRITRTLINADFFERKKYFFAFVRQRVAEILNSCL